MWNTHLYISLFLSVCLSVHPSRTIFSFMVHMCKTVISPGDFFSFHFFKILIFQVVKGVNEQKRVQNDKTFCHLTYTCVKLWYLQAFFPFFKIFIFCVVSGMKTQKMVQNGKKICPLGSIY